MDRTDVLRRLGKFYASDAARRPYHHQFLHAERLLNIDTSPESSLRVISREATNTLCKAIRDAETDGEQTDTAANRPAPKLTVPMQASVMLITSPVHPVLSTVFKDYPFNQSFKVVKQAGGYVGLSPQSGAAPMLVDMLPAIVTGLYECYMHSLIGPVGGGADGAGTAGSIKTVTTTTNKSKKAASKKNKNKNKKKEGTAAPLITGTAAAAFRNDVMSRPNVRGAEEFGPIFVVGLPRSGTSVLHRLLSLDPDARAPKNWEFFTPSATVPLQTRIKRATDYRGTREQNPHRYDELNPHFPAEDALFFMPLGGQVPTELDNSLPGAASRLAEWDLFRGTDEQVDNMCMHRLFVRLLECHGTQGDDDGKENEYKHWVFKDPAHLPARCAAILRVYPKAQFVWTHRPVEQCAASFAPEGHALAGAYLANLANLVERGLRFRETGSYEEATTTTAADANGSSSSKCGNGQEDRFQDVYLEDVVEDPVREMKKLYAAWGKTVSPEYEDKLKEWHAQNSRRPKTFARDHPAVTLYAERLQMRFAKYLSKFPRMKQMATVINLAEMDRILEADGEEGVRKLIASLTT